METSHEPSSPQSDDGSASGESPSGSTADPTPRLQEQTPGSSTMADHSRSGSVSAAQPYRPTITTTVGARPACLVNASVTYVGDGQIYAFGGFDQYTDEIYNHVLKLDLRTRQWSLVNNYGDIPGVRMGHTANLWQGDKLLVYGGENEHRAYLSDVIVLDLNTHTWTQPELRGPTPPCRARHAAVIDDDKLWIVGGVSGQPESYVLDDLCYLDLRTFTWSRTWKFVPRYDHSAWVWNSRLWVFGGMNHEMERTSEIWWLDIRDSASYEIDISYTAAEPASRSARSGPLSTPTALTAATSTGGGTANSAGHRYRLAEPGTSRRNGWAPGSIASLKFMSCANLPFQTLGKHFHLYSSGCLLDFNTPAGISSSSEIGLATLDLDTLQWHKLADTGELFHADYRWYYCALNQDGTQAWLLGCPTEPNNPADEYLSEFLHINIQQFGLPGNSLISSNTFSPWASTQSSLPVPIHEPAIGADLAKCFDQPPETGSGADFVVTAEPDAMSDRMSDDGSMSGSEEGRPRREIHVHKLILQARWPHFARLYGAKMAEYYDNRMHIPEPYSAVRAFLLYLYTDSIGPSTRGPLRSPGQSSSPGSRTTTGGAESTSTTGHRMALTNAPSRPLPACPTISEVAGMLVLACCYGMTRLHSLCVHRLTRQMTVDQAALIWDRAREAGEGWLQKRAAVFCLQHWGQVVRTPAFSRLDRTRMAELCCQAEPDSRVMNADEIDQVRENGSLQHPQQHYSRPKVAGGVAGGLAHHSLGGQHYRRMNLVAEAETDDDVDDMETEP